MDLFPSESEITQAVSTAYKFTAWNKSQFGGTVLRTDRLELTPASTLLLTAAAHVNARFIILAVRLLVVQGPDCFIQYRYLVDSPQNESGTVLRHLNGLGHLVRPAKPGQAYEGVVGVAGTDGRAGGDATCFDAPPLILIAENVAHVNPPGSVHQFTVIVSGVQGGLGGRGQDGGDGGNGGKGEDARGFPVCHQGKDGLSGGNAGAGGNAGRSTFGGRGGDFWLIGTPALTDTFNGIIKINSDGADGSLIGPGPGGISDNGSGKRGQPGDGGPGGHGHFLCSGGAPGAPGRTANDGFSRAIGHWPGHNPALQVPAVIKVDIRNDVSMFL